MTEEVEVKEKLLEIISGSSPDSVENLLKIAEKELELPNDVILKYLLELQNEGRLKLKQSHKQFSGSFFGYFFSNYALWFWVVILLSAATALSVYVIQENTFPLIYIRYFLGSIFVIYLPGFSLIKTFFPTLEVDKLERFALNIGMSLVLVPLVGLLLNYTPWGIRLTPVMISLLTMTVLLTITALIREYQALKLGKTQKAPIST